MFMHLVLRAKIWQFENYWSACPDDLLNKHCPQLQKFWFIRSRWAWKFAFLTSSQELLMYSVHWATLWQLNTTVRGGLLAPPCRTHTVPKRWACQLSACWGFFSTLISRIRLFNPFSSAFLWCLLPRLMFSVLHITLNRVMVSGLQKDSPVRTRAELNSWAWHGDCIQAAKSKDVDRWFKEERGAYVTTLGSEKVEPVSILWMCYAGRLRAQAHVLCRQESVMFSSGKEKK